MAPGGDRQSLIEPSYLTQKGVPGGEGHWLEAPSEVLPIDSRSGTYHQLMFLLSLSTSPAVAHLFLSQFCGYPIMCAQ